MTPQVTTIAIPDCVVAVLKEAFSSTALDLDFTEKVDYAILSEKQLLEASELTHKFFTQQIDGMAKDLEGDNLFYVKIIADRTTVNYFLVSDKYAIICCTNMFEENGGVYAYYIYTGDSFYELKSEEIEERGLSGS